MKRKVNRVGMNTLTVSLPSKWAKKHGIKVGDEIEVEEKENNLLVSMGAVKQQSEIKSIAIEIYSAKDAPKRKFILPYIRGYDEIMIYYKDPSVIDFIEKNMFILTGFEIVEQNKECIIMRNIVKIDDSSLNRVFDRVFNVTISMAKEIEKGFATGDFHDKESIIKYESLTNKLDFYCRRILNIHGYSNQQLTNSVYAIVRNLETITDILRDCIKDAPKGELVKDSHPEYSLSLFIDLIIINRKFFESKNSEMLYIIKKKEKEYLESLKKIKKPHIQTHFSAIYHPLHHISEEVC